MTSQRSSQASETATDQPEVPQPFCIDYEADYSASLLAIMPAMPMCAALLSVIFYVLPRDRSQWDLVTRHPLLCGLALTVVIWGGLAYFYHSNTRADRANPQTFEEFTLSFYALRAGIAAIEAFETTLSDVQRTALLIAKSYVKSIEAGLKRPGIQWVTGIGYTELWIQLHRAEEALIEAGPEASAISAAKFDEARIKDSALLDEAKLLNSLRLAVSVLSPAAAQLLLEPPAASTIPPILANPPSAPSGASRPAGEPVANAANPSQLRKLIARIEAAYKKARDLSGLKAKATSVCVDDRRLQAILTIRQVRRTVNEYRDDKWLDLIRIRNRVWGTLTLTGLLTLLLLSLALTGRHSMSFSSSRMQDPLVGATALFLIGAIVGLFDRLYRDAGSSTSSTDIDIGRAQALLTTVLSGLAAVGGVAIFVLSSAVVDIENVTTPTSLAIATTTAATRNRTSTAGFTATPTPSPIPSPTPSLTPIPGASPAPAGTIATPDLSQLRGFRRFDETRDGRQSSTLAEIFDLKTYPFAVVLAAMFGLTPGLVINRLKKVSDQQAMDLQSTGTTGKTMGGP